jgi:DNA polymerase-3 subunit gamma/tau
LVQVWGDHVIGRLRPKAKALFQAGRFVGVDGERAVFGLPNEIHRDRCEGVQDEIEQALSDQFGRPIALELVVDPGSEPPRVRTEPAPDGYDEPPASQAGRSAAGPARGAGAAATDTPPAPPGPDLADEADDLSVFDDELGEIAEVDNSAEARVLQAFPGAEEVG